MGTLKSVVKSRFGEFYKVQLLHEGNAQLTLKSEFFWNKESTQQFINNLIVPNGYWREIIKEYSTLPSPSSLTTTEIEHQVSALIMQGQLKLYPVDIPDIVEHPPEKRAVKTKENVTYLFSQSNILLITNPKEIIYFTRKKEAKNFLDKLGLNEEKLQTLAAELKIEQSKKSSANPDELIIKISAALASGSIIILVDRFSSAPSGNEKLVTLAGPGNIKVDLGPHSSAPQAQDKAPENIVAIREIASKSPTLTSNLSKLRSNGWKITKGTAGAGSYANKEQKTITIDANEFNNPASYIQTIAHESGHALYQADPYVPPNGLTRQEYIDANASSSLKDEGEATLMNIQIRDEILKNNGPDIGIAGTQGAAYEKSYQNYQQHGDREKARTEIGNVFANNEVPSTAPDKTYKQYYSKPYEDHWDKNIKKP